MLAPFNNRDLPTERQETVVLLHTTDEVKCCALWLWSNSCKISSTGWYWVCLLCNSFCLGSKFFCQTFFLTSIDFIGNTTFPLKANSDSHNFHCFFLFFRGSIDVFNERGRKGKGKKKVHARQCQDLPEKLAITACNSLDLYVLKLWTGITNKGKAERGI